jgi:hypothetical protein
MSGWSDVGPDSANHNPYMPQGSNTTVSYLQHQQSHHQWVDVNIPYQPYHTVVPVLPPLPTHSADALRFGAALLTVPAVPPPPEPEAPALPPAPAVSVETDSDMSEEGEDEELYLVGGWASASLVLRSVR